MSQFAVREQFAGMWDQPLRRSTPLTVVCWLTSAFVCGCAERTATSDELATVVGTDATRVVSEFLGPLTVADPLASSGAWYESLRRFGCSTDPSETEVFHTGGSGDDYLVIAPAVCEGRPAKLSGSISHSGKLRWALGSLPRRGALGSNFVRWHEGGDLEILDHGALASSVAERAGLSSERAGVALGARKASAKEAAYRDTHCRNDFVIDTLKGWAGAHALSEEAGIVGAMPTGDCLTASTATLLHFVRDRQTSDLIALNDGALTSPSDPLGSQNYFDATALSLLQETTYETAALAESLWGTPAVAASVAHHTSAIGTLAGCPEHHPWIWAEKFCTEGATGSWRVLVNPLTGEQWIQLDAGDAMLVVHLQQTQADPIVSWVNLQTGSAMNLSSAKEEPWLGEVLDELIGRLDGNGVVAALIIASVAALAMISNAGEAIRRALESTASDDFSQRASRIISPASALAITLVQRLQQPGPSSQGPLNPLDGLDLPETDGDDGAEEPSIIEQAQAVLRANTAGRTSTQRDPEFGCNDRLFKAPGIAEGQRYYGAQFGLIRSVAKFLGLPEPDEAIFVCSDEEGLHLLPTESPGHKAGAELIISIANYSPVPMKFLVGARADDWQTLPLTEWQELPPLNPGRL